MRAFCMFLGVPVREWDIQRSKGFSSKFSGVPVAVCYFIKDISPKIILHAMGHFAIVSSRTNGAYSCHYVRWLHLETYSRISVRRISAREL